MLSTIQCYMPLGIVLKILFCGLFGYIKFSHFCFLTQLCVPPPSPESNTRVCIFMVGAYFSPDFHCKAPPSYTSAKSECLNVRDIYAVLWGSKKAQAVWSASPNTVTACYSFQGWPLFHQLLVDLFKFLSPFLRNAELTKPTQLLYKVPLFRYFFVNYLHTYVLFDRRALYECC